MTDTRDLTPDGFVVSDPSSLGGTAFIRCTRLNVYAIAARLSGEETAEDIVRENPCVTTEMVEAAVEYARRHPQVEQPDGKPWRKSARATEPAK